MDFIKLLIKTLKKMKTLKLVIGLSIFSFLVFISCDKEVNETSTNNSSTSKSAYYSDSELALKTAQGVSLVCSGSCGCKVWMNLDTHQGGCTCSECVMDVTFHDKKVKLENKDKYIQSLFNLPLMEIAVRDFNAYAKKTYNKNTVGFDKIDFVITEKTKVITFHFKDDKGIEQTVLYSENNTDKTSKVAPKKFRVDCTGGCGCIEQFNFDTNTASCSCSDCSMTVTQL